MAANGPPLPTCAVLKVVSYLRYWRRAGRKAAIAVFDPEQPIVPAVTKKFCKDIAPFIQTLMLKTSPDRFDRWSGAPAGFYGAT